MFILCSICVIACVCKLNEKNALCFCSNNYSDTTILFLILFFLRKICLPELSFMNITVNLTKTSYNCIHLKNEISSVYLKVYIILCILEESWHGLPTHISSNSFFSRMQAQFLLLLNQYFYNRHVLFALQFFQLERYY